MIGEIIHQYRITEQIGQGGMGIVYRALDTKLDRDVALKFLPPHASADPDVKARFTAWLSNSGIDWKACNCGARADWMRRVTRWNGGSPAHS